jgi:hypothetical protein
VCKSEKGLSVGSMVYCAYVMNLRGQDDDNMIIFQLVFHVKEVDIIETRDFIFQVLPEIKNANIEI